ncbi:hypothetical protein HK101_007354 [Irineochytrium annulatum]|nr:hypothetical protein HK101_007354 [Irineochytrium annulatum]
MSTPIDLTGVVPLPLCFTVPPTSAVFQPGIAPCESLCFPDALSVVAGLAPTGDCYCLHVVNVTERAKLLCDQCPQGLPSGCGEVAGGWDDACLNVFEHGACLNDRADILRRADHFPYIFINLNELIGQLLLHPTLNASSSTLPQSTVLGIALGCVLLFLIVGGSGLFIAIRRLKQRKGQAVGSPTGKQREERMEFAGGGGGVDLTAGEVRVGVEEGGGGGVSVAKPVSPWPAETKGIDDLPAPGMGSSMLKVALSPAQNVNAADPTAGVSILTSVTASQQPRPPNDGFLRGQHDLLFCVPDVITQAFNVPAACIMVAVGLRDASVDELATSTSFLTWSDASSTGCYAVQLGPIKGLCVIDTCSALICSPAESE